MERPSRRPQKDLPDRKMPVSKRIVFKRRGFTLLELLIVIAVISVLAAIAIPTYTRLVNKARETAVISFLDDIKKAEETCRLEDTLDNYTGNFDDLVATGIILGSEGADPEHYERYDYRFDLKAETKDGEKRWRVKARPVDKNNKLRWFFIDQTGIIRYEVGKEAKDSSPPLGT